MFFKKREHRNAKLWDMTYIWGKNFFTNVVIIYNKKSKMYLINRDEDVDVELYQGKRKVRVVFVKLRRCKFCNRFVSHALLH